MHTTLFRNKILGIFEEKLRFSQPGDSRMAVTFAYETANTEDDVQSCDWDDDDDWLYALNNAHYLSRVDKTPWERETLSNQNENSRQNDRKARGSIVHI